MSKIFKQGITEFGLPKFSRIIRHKRDVILILLETMKLFLTLGTETIESSNSVYIKVDSISRAFYEFDNKIFSIHFPFTIIDNEDSTLWIKESNSEIEITNQIVSSLIGYFESHDSYTYMFDDIFNVIDDIEKEVGISENKLQLVLKKLISFEIGYFRYDVDEKHFVKGVHPLHHYDVNYSNTATYKLGLEKAQSVEQIFDMLDRNTNCHSLVKNEL